MDITDPIPQKVAKKHIDTRLLWRLRIFRVVSGLLLAFAIYDIYIKKISILYSLIGLSLGILFGIVAGRSFNIFWHPETKKVVAELDLFGMIVFVLYIFIEIKRKWIFGHWVEGVVLTAFCLIFATGAFLGRYLSIKNKICLVLEENNKI